MTVLFVHSHRFSEINGEFYSPGGLPKSIWRRYLSHFDNLIVLGRELNEKNKDKLSLSSHKNVSFELLDYLESPIAIFQHKKRLKSDIMNIIKKHNIQAVIARLPSSIGYKVIDVCKELDIPYAVEVVASSFDLIYNYKLPVRFHPGNLVVKLIAPLSNYYQKKYIKKSNFSIYVTEKYLQKKYPSKIKAITSYASNVELPAFDKNILIQHIDFLKRDNKTLKFGMIGNLDVHYKGYDIALKALALAKEQISSFELHFVGAGTGEKVKQLAKELNLEGHLVFNGKLPSGDSVFKYLDSLDVYLHPSRTEGLPRALIEAMGRACPCLASSVGGIPELLMEDFMHEAEDYQGLASQLIKLVNQKDFLIKAAKNNFHKAKEYRIEVLEQRRNKFWRAFYNYVSSNDKCETNI